MGNGITLTRQAVRVIVPGTEPRPVAVEPVATLSAEVGTDAVSYVIADQRLQRALSLPPCPTTEPAPAVIRGRMAAYLFTRGQAYRLSDAVETIQAFTGCGEDPARLCAEAMRAEGTLNIEPE